MAKTESSKAKDKINTKAARATIQQKLTALFSDYKTQHSEKKWSKKLKKVSKILAPIIAAANK